MSRYRRISVRTDSRPFAAVSPDVSSAALDLRQQQETREILHSNNEFLKPAQVWDSAVEKVLTSSRENISKSDKKKKTRRQSNNNNRNQEIGLQVCKKCVHPGKRTLFQLPVQKYFECIWFLDFPSHFFCHDFEAVIRWSFPVHAAMIGWRWCKRNTNTPSAPPSAACRRL